MILLHVSKASKYLISIKSNSSHDLSICFVFVFFTFTFIFFFCLVGGLTELIYSIMNFVAGSSSVNTRKYVSDRNVLGVTNFFVFLHFVIVGGITWLPPISNSNPQPFLTILFFVSFNIISFNVVVLE